MANHVNIDNVGGTRRMIRYFHASRADSHPSARPPPLPALASVPTLAARPMDPHWKTIVEQLRQQGHQSRYLDRFAPTGGRPMPTRGNGYDALQVELVRETAASLRRAEEKVNLLLLRLELLDREIAALLASPRKADRTLGEERTRAYLTMRDEAAQALHDYRVHREAVGFRWVESEMAALYPVPSRAEVEARFAAMRPA